MQAVKEDAQLINVPDGKAAEGKTDFQTTGTPDAWSFLEETRASATCVAKKEVIQLIMSSQVMITH